MSITEDLFYGDYRGFPFLNEEAQDFSEAKKRTENRAEKLKSELNERQVKELSLILSATDELAREASLTAYRSGIDLALSLFTKQ